MPTIHDALKIGHIDLRIQINQQRDPSAIALLDHIVQQEGDKATTQRIIELLDDARWCVITMAASYESDMKEEEE